MKYIHKYHPLFPLNILVGSIRNGFKHIREFIHLFLYSIGWLEVWERVKNEEDSKD